MSQYSNICILYYSGLMSLPIIGNFAYFIQSLLLNRGILKIFLASNKNSKGRKILFKDISQKFNFIYCRSYLLTRELRFLKQEKLILDTPNIKSPNRMAKEELYNLMWTMVFCRFVERKTKKNLKHFLPQDFPVKQ